MFADMEHDSRRILILSGLFALIGIVSLVIVFMQAPSGEDTSRRFSEFFGELSPEEQLAAKHEVLDTLSAAAEVDEEGRPTKEAKLKVLESLRTH